MIAKAVIAALERGARGILRSQKAKRDLFARPSSMQRTVINVLELTRGLENESFTDDKERAFLLGLQLGIAVHGVGALRRQCGKILKLPTLTADDLRKAESNFSTRIEQAKSLGVTDRHLRRLRRELLNQ